MFVSISNDNKSLNHQIGNGNHDNQNEINKDIIDKKNKHEIAQVSIYEFISRI